MKHNGKPLTEEERDEKLMDLAFNVASLRRDLFKKLTDTRRDIDDECGFPKSISAQNYQDAYEREPLAAAVVERWPLEAFQVWPEVYSNEDESVEDPFETAWYAASKQLMGVQSHYRDEKGARIGWYMRQALIDSRVSQYGVLLIGIDDDQPLSEPVAGVYEEGTVPAEKLPTTPPTGKQPDYNLTTNAEEVQGRKLLYLRSYTELQAPIARFETNRNSPRYGQPTHYRIVQDEQTSEGAAQPPLAQDLVHWTRVVHVCEGEVFHRPPMKQVYNDIYSERKLAGGSPEGFWKMCFTTLVLETLPQLGSNPRIDKLAVKQRVEEYQNSLQKILMLTGMSAKAIAPSVTDPTPHHNLLVERICIKERMPVRVFKGSERGELASSQDDAAWNDRVAAYQMYVVTPMVVCPLVDRLIMVGVLPEPPDGFCVYWPDITSMSAQERATVASTRMGTIAAFVDKGREAMTDEDFWTREMGCTPDEAEQIIANLEAQKEMLDEAQALLDEEAVGEEEELPFAEEVPDENAFCATGPGGGVDPTCGKGGGVSGKLSGLSTKMKLTKGILKKIDLVNPGGIQGGVVKLPAGLPDSDAQMIADKLGAKYEKVKTAGMLKGAKAQEIMAKALEGVADKGIAETAEHLHTGKGVEKFVFANTTLSLENIGKIKTFNPEGIKDGVLKVPHTADADDLAQLKSTMPPGTKIQAVDADGLKTTFKAAPPVAAAPKTYGELKAGDKYVNSIGQTKEIESITPVGSSIEVKFKGELGTATIKPDTPLPKPASTSSSSYDDDQPASTPKEKPFVDQFKAVKLTSGEKSAIVNYTGNGYSALNSAMRACPPDFECVKGDAKAKMDNILSAIDKAPPLPPGTTINRGMSLSGGKLDGFIGKMGEISQTGETFQFPSVTSTSIKSGFSGNIKFKIAAKTGLYVAPISKFESEKEVLVSPKTKYKVTKVVSKSAHKHVVHLEEV